MLEHVDAHLFENLPLCIELSRVPLLPLTFPQRLEFFGNWKVSSYKSFGTQGSAWAFGIWQNICRSASLQKAHYASSSRQHCIVTRPRTIDWRLDNEQSCPILLIQIPLLRNFPPRNWSFLWMRATFWHCRNFCLKAGILLKCCVGMEPGLGPGWPLKLGLWIRSTPGGFRFKDGQCWTFVKC